MQIEKKLENTLTKLRNVRNFPKRLNQWRELKSMVMKAKPEAVTYTLSNVIAFLHHEGFFLGMPLDICLETFMFFINDEGDVHEKVMKKHGPFIDRVRFISDRIRTCWMKISLDVLPKRGDILCATCCWFMKCTQDPLFNDTLKAMRYWEKDSPKDKIYVNDNMIRQHKLIVVRFTNPLLVERTLVGKMKFLQAQKYADYLERGKGSKYIFLEVAEPFAKSLNTIQFLHYLYNRDQMCCSHHRGPDDTSPICGCYLMLNTMHLSESKNFPTVGRMDNDIIIDDVADPDGGESSVLPKKKYNKARGVIRNCFRGGLKLCHYVCMKTGFYNFISGYVLKLCCSPYVSRDGPLPLHPRISTLIIRGKPEDKTTGLECLYRMLFSIDTFRNSKRSVTGINFIIHPNDPYIKQIGRLFCCLLNLWTMEEIDKEIDDSINSTIKRFERVKAEKTERFIDREEDENVKRRCVSRRKTQFFGSNVSWEVYEKETEKVAMEYKKVTTVRHYNSAKLVVPPNLLRAIHGFLEWNVDHYIEEYAFVMIQKLMEEQPKLKGWNCEFTQKMEYMEKDRIKGQPVWVKPGMLFSLYSFICIKSIPREMAKDIMRGIYSSRDRERAISRMQLILGNIKFNSNGIRFHKDNGFFENYYTNNKKGMQYVQEDIGTRMDSDVMETIAEEDADMVEKVNRVVFLFERRRYALKNLREFPFTSIIPSLKMKNPQFPVLVLGKKSFTKKNNKKDCIVVHTNHLMPKIKTKIKTAVHMISKDGNSKSGGDFMSSHYMPRHKTLDQNALVDCMNIYSSCVRELNKMNTEETAIV